MVRIKQLYGILALNLFILLPLLFETYNPSLSISFSALGGIVCPLISILSIFLLARPHQSWTIHRFIALAGHSMILLYVLVLIIFI